MGGCTKFVDERVHELSGCPVLALAFSSRRLRALSGQGRRALRFGSSPVLTRVVPRD